jgi:hypothetical protein
VHDAPDRAEKAYIRSHRSHRAKEGEIGFQCVQLALEARAHGAACTVEQGTVVGDSALAQLLVFAHATGKNSFHGATVARALRGSGIELVEVGTRPELALEVFVVVANAANGEDLAEDRGPADHRNHHQQHHHGLHHPARVEHQLNDGEILGHGFSETVGGRKVSKEALRLWLAGPPARGRGCVEDADFELQPSRCGWSPRRASTQARCDRGPGEARAARL